ncbi:MAG: CDP-diacylglycerol--serine O-phosphatidyltransferase [candidate division Zixibacteria bacterium]|nr:CDP-diacylglycerol--serine O-phosphatidyltransferase [candidate division Zixibacteria bacterium]
MMTAANYPEYSGRTEGGRRDYRGLFPGVFTMGNLVCGFLSVLSVSEGDVVTGCWFILLAAFLDLLDGKVARLAGVESRLGMELDSLADFMSFGVAPAFLVHAIMLGSIGKWGWIIAVVYIMAAGYRLARYNLLSQSEEKQNFLGMPVPVAALGPVTFVIFSYHIWGDLQYSEYLISMMILFSGLMVSQVEFEAVPDRFGRAERVKLVLAILIIVALVINARLTLFPIIAAYILTNLVRESHRLFTRGVDKVRSRSGQD